MARIIIEPIQGTRKAAEDLFHFVINELDNARLPARVWIDIGKSPEHAVATGWAKEKK